jgi:hypothetical protein
MALHFSSVPDEQATAVWESGTRLQGELTMKRLHQLMATLVALTTATLWADSIGTVGGNLPIQRNIGADELGGFYALDSNRPFTSDGNVNVWEVYVNSTHSIQLVIYRSSGGAFIEVGRSEMVTPALGYNRFSLSKNIKVLAGDFVGFYSPDFNPISFTGVSAGACTGFLTETVLFTGAPSYTASSPVFGGSCPRTYSLRAFQSNDQ